MSEPDTMTALVDTIEVVRRLLATLPRATRLQLAREGLGQVDGRDRADDAERASVASLFRGDRRANLGARRD